MKKKWEYLEIEDYDQKEFNRLGKLGWELAGVYSHTFTSQLHWIKSVGYYMFKRPLN